MQKTVPTLLAALAALLLSACGAPAELEPPTSPTPAPPSTAVVRFDLAVSPARVASASAPAPALRAGAPVSDDAPVAALGAVGEPAAHLALFDAEALWAGGRGEGVVIAIVDSGVDAARAGLAGRVLSGLDLIGDGATRDGRADPYGHGTGMALAAAGEGVGLAPDASVLPVRVLDAQGLGSPRDVAAGVLWAVGLDPERPNPTPAHVVSLSLGGAAYSPALHDAIRAARDAGAVVIAAAGNAGGAVAYPAALPEVVGVGAAEASGGAWRPAGYSNRGDGLDLLAPMGGAIDTNRGRYASAGLELGGEAASGTSYAAAQTAGVAALLVAAGASGDAATAALRLAASDLDEEGLDAATGRGLLSPAAALRAVRDGAAAEGRVAVQVLDAGGLQEIALVAADPAAGERLELAPGRYRFQAWMDLDRDGLRDPEEPAARSDDVELVAGLELELGLLLD